MPTSHAFAPLLALSFLALSASVAAAADTPVGTVVLAKSTPQALLLWDSTPALAKLVGDKVGAARALATLESSAILIAAKRSPDLSSAKTITVQVIYSKTGAVSPVYNTATFAGVEKLLTVTGSPADLVQNGASYAAAILRGSVPSTIVVSVTGKLPPM